MPPTQTQPSVAAIVVLTALAAVLAVLPVNWPVSDFGEYWAAGRVMISGGNPYDAGSLQRTQLEIGLNDSQPIMMYNPPWILALAMPAAVLPFHIARSIWLPLEILIVMWSVSRLWVIYGGAADRTINACYLGLAWMPTLICLSLGQVSALVLLGLVAFVWFIGKRWDFAAGASLTLTVIKPHIVALVWAALVVWIIANRRWRLALGIAAGIVVATLIVISVNSEVFAEYRALMAGAPPTLEFESPNIATVLRWALGVKGSWPQFVPSALGGAAVSLMAYRRRSTWEWTKELPSLTLWSCLLTAYGGWTFDLIVLLIPVVVTAAAVTRIESRRLWPVGCCMFLAISLLALGLHQAHARQATFLWMTPTILAGCTLLRHLATAHSAPPLTQSCSIV